MPRSPKKKSSANVTESLRLINLSLAVAQSASRIEDWRWQLQLDGVVTNLLAHQQQALLDFASEQLFHAHPSAYEVLIETIESMSSACQLEFEGVQYDVLLIAAPILAWSRFDIAAGDLSPDLVNALSSGLQKSVLSSDARVRVLPTLYAVDQLPENNHQSFQLMHNTALSILKDQPLSAPKNMPKTVPFLADSRYVLAVIVVPAAKDMFVWQTLHSPFDCEQAKSDALEQWRRLAHPIAMRMLPGCGIELLMPEAYYSARRISDVQIRPVAVRAAVFYLIQTLNIEPGDLSAVIAGFGAENNMQNGASVVDEFRISFSLKNPSEVIHGVIWPLFQQDDEMATIGDEEEALLGEIPAVLAECGISNIKKIDRLLPLEFCDDCNAPLFANANGDIVHAEMPDDAPNPASHQLH
jgi:hypothetical protein